MSSGEDLLNQIIGMGGPKKGTAIDGAPGAGVVKEGSPATGRSASATDEDILTQILNEPRSPPLHYSTHTHSKLATDPHSPMSSEDNALLAAFLAEEVKLSRPSVDRTPTTSTAPSTSRARSESQTASKANSLDEESLILDAMLKAIEDDEQSVDSSELGLTSAAADIADDVEKVVEHASRIARGELEQKTSNLISSANQSKSMHSEKLLLVMKNNPTMMEEMKRAVPTTGATTCFGVSRNGTEFKFATGTSLGIVLLYNAQGRVKIVCGHVADDKSDDKYRGVVTCVSMVPSGEAVLAGYERGHVVWWESRTAQPIKIVTDSRNDPTLRIAIFHDVFRLASVNSIGVIRLFNMNYVMTKWVCQDVVLDHKMPFLVTDIASIMSDKQLSPRNQQPLHYLAVACTDCVKVFAIKFGTVRFDTTEIFYTKAPMMRNPTTATTVVWRICDKTDELAATYRGSDENTDILCVGWDMSVSMYRLMVSEDSMGLEQVSFLSLPYTLSSMTHIMEECVAGSSAEGHFVVFDVRHGTIVDTCFTEIEPPLVSSSWRKNNIHTHCVGADGCLLYVCTASKCSSIRMRTWEESLNILSNQMKWSEALEVAMQCYNNTAVGLVGISNEASVRTEVVGTKMNTLINQYISHEVTNFTASRKATDSTVRLVFFHNLGKYLVTYCANSQMWDSLFGPVFGAFARNQQEDIFVYLLEDLCHNATETSKIRMPEFFIDALMHLFLDDGAKYKAIDDAVNVSAERKALSAPDRVEQCLMRLSESFEYSLKKAIKAEMFRAMCMLYCHGMLEYSVPMAQLLAIGSHKSLSVMLEYARLVFKGETFIVGRNVPAAKIADLRMDVITHACSEESMLKLLKISVKDYLELLDMTLNDADVWLRLSSRFDLTLQTRQSILERLITLTIDTTTSPTEPWTLLKKPWPTFPEITLIMVSLMKYFTSQSIVFDKPVEMITRAITVLTYQDTRAGGLTPPIAVCSQAEKEQVIAGLLRSKHRPPDLDWRLLQGLAEQANFYYVVVMIHELQGKYVLALQYLLRAAKNVPEIKRNMFIYLRTTIENFQSRDMRSDIESLGAAVVENIAPLIEMDAIAASQLVILYLPARHEEIVQKLKSTPTQQFKYMYNLIYAYNDNSSLSAHAPPERNYEATASFTTHFEAKSGLDFFDKNMQNTFISLMCQHQPDEVYSYLLMNDGKCEYDIEKIMQVCKQYKVIDAQTFLLEKTNQITQAMELLIMSLTTKMQIMRKEVIASPSSETLMTSASFNDVKRYVDVGIQLCVRNYQHLDDKESHNVWFALLDRFVKPRESITNRMRGVSSAERMPSGSQEDYLIWNDLESPEVALSPKPKALSSASCSVYKGLLSIYTHFMKYILNCMVEDVGMEPATVWSKIQRDNPMDTYGEFKQILGDILEQVTYSLASTQYCFRIMKNDSYRLGETLRRIFTRPVSNMTEYLEDAICSLCGQPMVGKEGASLRYYSCGHLFHDFCCPYSRCSICISDGKKRVTRPVDRPGSMQSKPSARPNTGNVSKLDKKEVKKILGRIERVRTRLEVGQFLDTQALCDNSASLAAALKYESCNKVQLLLAPLWGQGEAEPPRSPLWASGPPRDIEERKASTLPKNSVKSIILSNEELLDLFGDECVQRERDMKAERSKKKQIAAQQEKISKGDVRWDEDDADALAWDT